MKVSMRRSCHYFFTFIVMFLVFSVFDVPGGSKIILFLYYFVVLSLAVLLLFFGRAEVKLKVFDIFVMLSIVIIFSLASFFVPDQAVGTLTLLVLSILISLVISLDFERNKNIYVMAIQSLLLLHVVAFFIQFLIFIISGKILDLHTVVFFFSESHTAELNRVNLFGARLTGLHNEPGTYATWVMPLLFLLLFIEKEIRLLSVFALLSLILTFSVSGYVYTLLFVLASFFVTKPSNRMRYFIKVTAALIVCAIVFLSLGGYEYLMWRFFDESVVDGTSELKWISIRHLIETDYVRLMLGSGLGVNDCASCTSLQDTGLAFNLIFQLGVFGLIIILLSILYTRSRTFPVSIFLGALFISKMFVFSLSFWVSLGLLSAIHKIKTKESQYRDIN